MECAAYSWRLQLEQTKERNYLPLVVVKVLLYKDAPSISNNFKAGIWLVSKPPLHPLISLSLSSR